jgi:hypothetical protein
MSTVEEVSAILSLRPQWGWGKSVDALISISTYLQRNDEGNEMTGIVRKGF